MPRGVYIRTNPCKIILNKEKLEDLYINNNLNTRDCGKILKVSKDTILRNLKKFNIPTPGRYGSLVKPNRIKTSSGYILILKPDHPNANKKGYVREHAFLMSQKLGRPLTKNETVHHKNGIRNDNELKNLELWVTNQPTGQRVRDKINWAIEFLKEYYPSVLNFKVANNYIYPIKLIGCLLALTLF